MKYYLFILFVLFLTLLHAQGPNFNPTDVSYLKAVLTQHGTLGSTEGQIYKINMDLSIPQQTEYQDVNISLSNDSTVFNDGVNDLLRISSYDYTYEYNICISLSYPYV